MISGKWGSFGKRGCNLPEETYQSMVRFIADTLKPDMVMWTGDFTPHEIWSHSYELSSMYQKYLAKTLTEDFKDIEVYAILGNHDAMVLNTQDMTAPEQDAMIKLVADEWYPHVIKTEEAL